MTSKDVSVVQLSNDIEWVLVSSKDTNAGLIARDIAEELMRKYTIIAKPAPPKSYEGKPRGGGIW